MADTPLPTDPRPSDEPHAFLSIIVKPFRVESVLRALERFPLVSLNVVQVKGYGRQKGHLELYRGREYAISFIPKAKIEVTLPRALLDEASREVEKAARTGRIGDGKIFCFELESIDAF